MKFRIFFIIFVLIFLNFSTEYCHSKEVKNNDCGGNLFCSNAQKASIQKNSYKNDIEEVKKLFKNQTIYLNSANINELKKIYSEDYLSNDGFDLKTLFKLYEDTVKNHPDIKYNLYIRKICVQGNYATVKTTNKSTATTAEKSGITGDKGLLKIDMETVFYLKKNCGEWKIVAEETISEKTSLLYGDCKKTNIELFAPECIAAGKSYTVTLKLPIEYSKYSMGALKKDPIIFPSPQVEDIFKTFDSTGVIERVFKSNTKGNNETVAASVAFALLKKDKCNNISNIKISGLGVLLQRVNVITPPQK